MKGEGLLRPALRRGLAMTLYTSRLPSLEGCMNYTDSIQGATHMVYSLRKVNL